MKKTGIIPPHYLYFLENEGIDIVDFKSSNFDMKETYDRMIIKFPFCSSTLDIQVIFDNVDICYSPDFVILNDFDCLINYQEIVKDWNFRPSQSLYHTLRRIKECYSLEQEKKLNQIIAQFKKGSKEAFEQSHYAHIENIIGYIKKKLSAYTQFPKESKFFDISISFSISGKDSRQITEVEIAYPLDCLIRSREIPRAPILHIIIPLGKEMKFFVDLTLPHFISKDTVSFSQEIYNLSDFNNIIPIIENNILKSFNVIHVREKIITKIIESNIGFPLEIDTYSFLKLDLYCHHIKTINLNNSNPTNINATTLKNTISSTIIIDCNFILHFIFSPEEHSKFEFQIIDGDKLTVIMRKKVDYGPTEREINNLLHLIVSTLLECFQKKKKRSD